MITPNEMITELHGHAMRAGTIREAIAYAIRAGIVVRQSRLAEDNDWLPADTGVTDRVLRLYADTATLWPDAETVCRYADCLGMAGMVADATLDSVDALTEAAEENDRQLKAVLANPLATHHENLVVRAKACVIGLRCERMRYRMNTQ